MCQIIQGKRTKSFGVGYERVVGWTTDGVSVTRAIVVRGTRARGKWRTRVERR